MPVVSSQRQLFEKSYPYTTIGMVSMPLSSMILVILIMQEQSSPDGAFCAEDHREAFNTGGSVMTTQMQQPVGGASPGGPRVQYTRVGWVRTAWGMLFWYALSYSWLVLTRFFRKP